VANSNPVPVIPTLAYANPLGGQPLGGRLNVVWDENGVTVTDPRSAATSPALIKWTGIVLLTLAGGAAIINGLLLLRGRSDLGHLIAALFALACGALCVFGSSRMKQDPRVVRVEAGRVYVTGCNMHLFRPRWLSAKQFSMTVGSLDLGTLQRFHDVKVERSLARSNVLLPALQCDEAIWVVDLMNKALNAE
jgi:hypothetical protein